MRFVDSWRAQYYLSAVDEKIDEVSSHFSNRSIFCEKPHKIIDEFSEQLCAEIDRILLPSVCYEISVARSKGELEGASPQERYTSFFVRNNHLHHLAKDFIGKYPFVFEMVDTTIKNSYINLQECLTRFEQDKDLFEQLFPHLGPLSIRNIRIIDASDRHRGKQALELVFSEGSRLIYKPVDLSPDLLYSDFVRFLDFPKAYELRCMRIVPQGQYGWIEYIPYLPCEDEKEVGNFFRRAGVLLAVTDALNYTDGHCENLIAAGQYPVLLDGETFFQNFDVNEDESKNILSTMLIQKMTKARIPPYTALQSPPMNRAEVLYPHPENDHTDAVKVRYRGLRETKGHHCPFIRGRYFTASEYVKDIIDGFCFAYDLITKKTPDILNWSEWWTRLKNVRCRSVVRDTASYVYLIRRIQQPEICSARSRAEALIRDKLADSYYLKYEMTDLLKLDVPYFYHYPGELHFYDGADKKFSNVFFETATEQMRKGLLHRCEQKKQFNCEIIRRHLLPYH